MSINLTGLVKQLRAILGKMEAVLGAIADAIVWTGSDGKIQWCNSAFDQLVNQPHIRVLNVKLSDLLFLSLAGEAVAPEFYPNMKVLEGKCEITEEYECYDGRNRSLIVEISGNCVELPGGDKSAVLVIRDITQAKRWEAERSLAEQKQAETLSLLQATLESTADGIIVVNQDFNVAVFNQKFLQMWSISESLLQPDKSKERFKFMSEQMRDPEAFIARVKELFYEYPEQAAFDLIEMKDGRVFERYSQPQWQGNKIIGRVWSFRDVTERKQAEAALLKSEQKFRHLFENSQFGILRSRIEDGLVLDANQRLAELLGYTTLADLIGKKFTTEFYANLSDRQRILTQLRQKGTLNNIELQFNRRDGKVIWGLFSLRWNVEDNCIEAVVADISDRKQAEADLHRSHAILKAQQEASIDGILVVDENNQIVSFNQRFCQLWQISETFVSGNNRRLLELALAKLEKPQEFLAKVEYLYAHPEEVSRDEIRLKDGRTLDRYSASVRSLTEDYYGRIWYFRDISERKTAEEALRRSEKKYRNIFENFQVGIARIRIEDGLFLEANQRQAKILGYSSAADLIGKQFTTEFYAHPSDRQKLLAELEQQGEVRNFEVQLRRRDQSLGWGLLSLRRNVEEGCIDAVITDISDRKQAEAALEHRARMDNLLTSISRQFIDQDADTAINFTLQAIAEFLGAECSCIFEYYDQQQQFHMAHEWRNPSSTLLLANISASEPLPWFYHQILNGNPIQSLQASRITQMSSTAHAETELIKSVVAVPMIYSGKVVGLLELDAINKSKTWSQEEINLLQRVSELIAIGRSRHKAEEALRIAKEAAETANHSKSAFLANMSHELRTPLNAILGFAQLMERDTTLSKRQRDSLATINRSGEHLLNLINDVLEMSKIEAGRIVLNPTAFDLYGLLQNLQEMFRVRAEAKKLSLSFELAPNLPQYIFTDESKLRQILINLLSNAIKFTDTGGVTLHVKLATTALASNQYQPVSDAEDSLPHNQFLILFEIEDTGLGIAEEELDNLFQPFVQTASSTKVREGTGLGLTISRQFVQLMGGDIRLQSVVGRGSTFYFDIKIQLAQPLEIAPQTVPRKVMALAPGQPVYRILVVDDRKDNCDLLTQLFNMIGFETLAAANGQEAIALWQAWHPHLIWMDMRMPVIDGYEATRQIRAMEQAAKLSSTSQSRTVIIALTASAFEEQRCNILAAGCDDLIRKPFREDVILSKMAEFLGVSYVYAQEPENIDQMRSATSELETLKPQDLLIMPEEWRNALYQAAVQVDAEIILQLIAQIPKTHLALSERLTDLVNRFCFDEIIDLTPGKDNV
ncbi:PAS domain S-box protein [Nostoc sp. CHAB 5844]|nr:PAS domain S-box protein [Nostoc sp. CHAB 5844]